ncbi:MAG: hypothetical protein A3G23_04510 [Bacteroidetes bacterium RIFCSPLOWO2_12_FULL_37_12]|nr:MAG: hypothetical protein A3G23_04510 [Bacteroidetes bacterium RIFCSPLOWO2_12_FULL_37_12]
MADSIYKKANRFFAMAKYDSTLFFINLAISAYRKDTSRIVTDKFIKCYLLTAIVLKEIGKADSAVQILQKTERFIILKQGKKVPLLAECYNLLGIMFQTLGKYTKALTYHNKSIDLKLIVYGEKHIQTSKSYNNIGYVYFLMGDYEKTLDYYNKAFDIKKNSPDASLQDVSSTINNIGLLFHEKGDWENAEHYFQESLSMKLKYLNEDHPEIATILNSFGLIYYEKGEISLASDYYYKAFNIRLKSFGEMHPDVALSYNYLGMVYDDLGNYDKALEYFNKALAIQYETLDSIHPLNCEVFLNIGYAHLNAKLWQLAVTDFLKALHCLSLNHLEEYYKTAENLANIATAYWHLNIIDSSLYYNQKSIDLFMRTFGFQNRVTANVLLQRGGIFYLTNKPHEALALYQKTLRSLIPSFQENNIYTNPVLYAKNNVKNDMKETILDKNTLLETLEAKADCFELMSRFTEN